MSAVDNAGSTPVRIAISNNNSAALNIFREFGAGG